MITYIYVLLNKKKSHQIFYMLYKKYNKLFIYYLPILQFASLLKKPKMTPTGLRLD